MKIAIVGCGPAVLRALGLSDEIHDCGRRIDNIYGVSVPTMRTVLDVDYQALGEEFYGLAVHRAALFEVLYADVCSREIKIRTGLEIRGMRRDQEHLSIIDTRNNVFGNFDLVIDASGARTRLQQYSDAPARRRILKYGALWGCFDWPESGFGPHTLAQRYVGAHTMIGVLPIGRHNDVCADQAAFFWSIKSQDYDQWMARGLDAWKNDVRAIWPETDVILQQISQASQMTLATYDHRTMRRPYGDKIVFLGDAAHSTSPQSSLAYPRLSGVKSGANTLLPIGQPNIGRHAGFAFRPGREIANRTTRGCRTDLRSVGWAATGGKRTLDSSTHNLRVAMSTALPLRGSHGTIY